MGMHGPIPKREDQLTRRNAVEVPVDKVTVIGPVPIPELGITRAHPLVKDLYESLKNSGQNRFYEPSDWAYARLTMYLINEMLQDTTNKDGSHKTISAMKIAAVTSMMTPLLMTEGDRRRVRMEVERQPATPGGAKVIEMSDVYKERLGVASPPAFDTGAAAGFACAAISTFGAM